MFLLRISEIFYNGVSCSDLHRTTNGKAYFAKRSHVVEVSKLSGALIPTQTDEKVTPSNTPEASFSFNIGDYVLVKDNRKGFVRFIGTTGLVRYLFAGSFTFTVASLMSFHLSGEFW